MHWRKAFSWLPLPGQAAWEADVADLKNSGLTPKALEAFVEWRQTHPDAPEKLADYCERKGVGLCTFFDEDYPPLLKEISVPPIIFYYRGKILPNVERVGIVGTRNARATTRLTVKMSHEISAENLRRQV